VNGALTAVFARESGQLRRYPADLSVATVVRNASTVTFVGQREDGTSFMVIDGILRKVASDGTTPWLAMKKPQRGYTIRQVVLVDATLFIFEDALSASESRQTRVYRLDVDRAGVIVLAMLNLPAHGTFAGATDTKLLYLQGGGTDASGQPVPQELRSVPLDTTQSKTEWVRIYRIENGAIAPIAVNANRVFFNVTDRGVSPAIVHADVRLDTGLALMNGAKRSAWLGTKPDAVRAVGALPADWVVLAKDADSDPSLAGAALYRLDPVTLATQLIRDLPTGTRPSRLTGIGPAAAENFNGQVNAYAIDVGQARFLEVVGATALR
jgi:hypothetical protein